MVDDYEPFRRFLTSTLQQRSDLQIIAEVSDGLEAVRKAEELQPELIVLDIGLPILNGIEAATRIHSRSPLAKILFVSQQTSTEIVHAAYGTGAQGYVVKMDAGRELMAAINAVLGGGTYVSSRLREHGFGQSLAPGAMSRNEFLAPTAPKRPHEIKGTGRHEALFYSDDASLLDELTRFVGTALKAGNAAIVVATQAHRESLLPRLQAHGLDIAAAIEQGRYIALDAAETLSILMVNSMPDPARFLKLLGDLVVTSAKAAKGEQARVAIFGECVQLLWTQGNVEAAIQFERLGNHLAKKYDIDILCGYSPASVQGRMDDHIFQRICAEHSAFHSI